VVEMRGALPHILMCQFGTADQISANGCQNCMQPQRGTQQWMSSEWPELQMEVQ
jgi:hypothetical protein